MVSSSPLKRFSADALAASSRGSLGRRSGSIRWRGHPQEDTMSTQSDHGHELIPRPEHTPDALRAALAAVEPGRLEEMQAQKDEAFAKAVEWQSLSPV